MLRPRELRVFAGAASNGAQPSADLGALVARARPVVIEAVWPEIDAGRHPVKRIAGERFDVQADIFREGHDAIAGVLKFRERGATAWRETPLAPFDNDRWRGEFVLERNARYDYTLEAWPDVFGSWHHDVERKREAGQPVELDLIEGRALVEAARGRASAADRARIDATLRELETQTDDDGRAAVLLAPELGAVMARAPDRSRATVYARELEVIADRPAARFAAWYELFPRSQAQRSRRARHVRRRGDAAAARSRARLRRRVPAADPPDRPRVPQGQEQHARSPDPTIPAARGRSATRTAATRRSNPQLGTLDDFDRFVDAARAHGLEVALDYALQCSPDHPWVREHPEWFIFRPDGTIKYAENPPKKYQDIVNFDWYGPPARDAVDGAARRRRFWIAPRRAHLPRRQPAHQAVRLLGVDDRRRAVAPSRRAVPRRGVHAAQGDAGARQARLHAVVHLLHLAQLRRRARRLPQRARALRDGGVLPAELLRRTRPTFCRRSCRAAAGRRF